MPQPASGKSSSTWLLLAAGIFAGCHGLWGADDKDEATDTFYGPTDTLVVVKDSASNDTLRFPIRRASTLIIWKIRILEAGLYRLNAGNPGWVTADIDLVPRTGPGLPAYQDHGYDLYHSQGDSGWVPGQSAVDTAHDTRKYSSYFAYLDTGWIEARVSVGAWNTGRPTNPFLLQLERDTADRHEHDDHGGAPHDILPGQEVESEIWPSRDEDNHRLIADRDTIYNLRFETTRGTELHALLYERDSAVPDWEATLLFGIDMQKPSRPVTVRKGRHYTLQVRAAAFYHRHPEGGSRYRFAFE